MSRGGSEVQMRSRTGLPQQRGSRPRKLSSLVVLLPLLFEPGGRDVSDFVGGWQGRIEAPGGRLGIRVNLEHGDNGWTGTIDIPQQGVKELALEGVVVDGQEVGFSIRGVPGSPTFRGSLSAGVIEGEFMQGPATLAFRLIRGEVPEALPPRRSQDPRGPFPYEAVEVEYKSGSVSLAGTLTTPLGTGPHPAVLLLSGSGAQNRDGEVFGHRPFAVLADHLTRRGFAVLRMDDRGAGASSRGPEEATTQDLSEDAVAGLSFLKSRSEIAPGRVGLLGHSEGALVAAITAAESQEPAFVIMLAGPGRPGKPLVRAQNRSILEAAGTPAETVAWHEALVDDLIELALGTRDEERLRLRLEEERRQRASGPSGSLSVAETLLLETVERQIPRFVSPWFLQFLRYDPRVALRQVRVPVLALAGELDLQVPPALNQTEIRNALDVAGNTDVTCQTFARLNHLFQEARTGHPAEYPVLEETISPRVLRAIAEWLGDRFGGAAATGRSSKDEAS